MVGVWACSKKAVRWMEYLIELVVRECVVAREWSEGLWDDECLEN